MASGPAGQEARLGAGPSKVRCSGPARTPRSKLLGLGSVRPGSPVSRHHRRVTREAAAVRMMVGPIGCAGIPCWSASHAEVAAIVAGGSASCGDARARLLAAAAIIRSRMQLLPQLAVQIGKARRRPVCLSTALSSSSSHSHPFVCHLAFTHSNHFNFFLSTSSAQQLGSPKSLAIINSELGQSLCLGRRWTWCLSLACKFITIFNSLYTHCVDWTIMVLLLYNLYANLWWVIPPVWDYFFH